MAARGVTRAASGAALAVSLLTIVPVRVRRMPAGLGDAAAWFPLVGGLVGGAAGAARSAADATLGPGVAAVLAAIVVVALPGGLHQDGLADCADVLGVRGGAERRLAVMRESTIGAFGALALVLWVALLVAAMAALPRADALPALVLAGGLGRYAAVLHAALVPPARPDGLGAAFAVGAASVVVATVVVLAGVALAPLPGLAALAMTLLVTAAVGAWARRALGGRTGDTLGATIALAEVMALVVLLGFAR